MPRWLLSVGSRFSPPRSKDEICDASHHREAKMRSVKSMLVGSPPAPAKPHRRRAASCKRTCGIAAVPTPVRALLAPARLPPSLT
jgi:hypothetical protein